MPVRDEPSYSRNPVQIAADELPQPYDTHPRSGLLVASLVSQRGVQHAVLFCQAGYGSCEPGPVTWPALVTCRSEMDWGTVSPEVGPLEQARLVSLGMPDVSAAFASSGAAQRSHIKGTARSGLPDVRPCLSHADSSAVLCLHLRPIGSGHAH